MTERTGRLASLHLGDTLKSRRTELGITLEELEGRTGVPMGWISRMERGLMPDPKIKTLVKVGAELGYSPNQLARMLGIWHGIEESEWYPAIQRFEQSFAKASTQKQEQATQMLAAIQSLLDS